MKFVSYAQNFEDVMLWRALGHVKNGFYIDVGAWSPLLDSVTRAFYERGWSGINVEPNVDFVVEYAANRDRDLLLSVAMGSEPGSATIFIPKHSGLSSLKRDDNLLVSLTDNTMRELTVQVLTLKELFSNYADKRETHFLKIDVEGFEKEVILGNDWSKFRPWVLVIEATLPNSSIENAHLWSHLLIDADYIFAYRDGLNHFYIAKEHEDLLPAFRTPPNVFDEFITANEERLESDLLMRTQQLEYMNSLYKDSEVHLAELRNQVQSKGVNK